MSIFIAADHAGFSLKEQIKEALQAKGKTLEDLGPFNEDAVDYPDFAHKLCKRVLEKKDTLGILVCGTGIGMSMAANRHPGIRAAQVFTPFMATMAKQHNQANVLCLGSRVLTFEQALPLVEAWLGAKFLGDRHERRVQKIELNS